MEDLGHSLTQNLINRMWKQVLPPKLKLFSWSLIKGKLQTRKKLSKFIPNINTQCPMCNNHEEEIDHLFLHCHYAKQVWSCATDMSLSDFDSNLMISEWLANLSHNNSNVVSNLNKAVSICWQIWNDTNGSIFRNVNPVHNRAFLRAMAMVNDYFKENVES